MRMSGCEMYVVKVSAGISGLMCGNCGGLTLNTDAAYCPHCGAKVANVEDDGDSFEGWGSMRYAHDVGFDEGWQAAMEEMA